MVNIKKYVDFFTLDDHNKLVWIRCFLNKMYNKIGANQVKNQKSFKCSSKDCSI